MGRTTPSVGHPSWIQGWGAARSRYSAILFFEYWLPLIVWLFVIYLFSSDSFSGDETSKIIGPVLRFFAPDLSPAQMDFWHGMIRKAGHVTEYFILGLLTYRVLRLDQPDAVKAKLMAAGLIALAALTDEFHQTLTISRVGSLVDVGYDCLGGAIALAIRR